MDAVQWFLNLFYALVFPGLLFAAALGLFMTWVDRKVTAVVQSRVGPPWYQPYADIGKLLGKKMVLPHGHRAGFLLAPLLSLTGAALSATLVFLAIANPGGGFVGDVIVVIYLAVLPPAALLIGGAASRSPFGAIGAGREMSMVLAYEAGFLLALLTVFIQARSATFAGILAFQAENGPVIASVSGVLAFVAALLCIQAKLGFLPFDISEADTEIIGGPLAEYSGVGLALFRVSRSILFVQLPAMLALLFFGAPAPHLLSWLVFILEGLVVFGLIVLIKITHARLRLDQALRFFWGRVLVAGLAAVGLALLGL